ncbi:alcohol dehydrogenase catalytic domain-containing protein [Sphingopyxis sp.]|uniref:alcohol dehydrogenase catalytic domain-containing protein n=1 Tax=Sphingopyxis sp. TaxID=1908224 RepID=UPI002B4823EC|nr:alcohol dehydrogenase catalytic domain-containing protein [Sphingopyxis sp.]HJS09753.1 alcohol dehydrogenase catalytic domain-containing protein [Sphingopyxis sp.]
MSIDMAEIDGDRVGTAVHETMRAARYHRVGAPFSVDVIDRPSPRPHEVVVQVHACGLVPNYATVLEKLRDHPAISAPTLPAIYGLDPAGVIVEKGCLVHGLEIGDRVYANPLRYCGSCRACRRGQPTACDYGALSNYFGFGPKSAQTLADYPYGGFAEFMVAPQESIVKLPPNVPFEVGARWGYLGTGYGAVRAGNVDVNTTVLINGVSGTLGLGAALFALAMGAPRIFGVGRNPELLERVKALAPDRIDVLCAGEGSISERVRALTGGEGANVVIDALSTGSSAAAYLDAFGGLAKGGTHVNVGGVLEPVPLNMLMLVNEAQTLIGSLWFSTAQGQEMADLAAMGRVTFDMFDTKVFPLEGLNTALSELNFGCGGFTNYVICPQL